MPPDRRSSSAAVLGLFSKLNVWKRADRRAPHKPLLVLLALGRLQQGRAEAIPFRDVDKQLTALLREFGPPGAANPQLPFWHLQSDRVWTLENADHLKDLPRGKCPPKGYLREVSGRFSDDVRSALVADPELVGEVASRLLQAHFPESLHQDILDQVGLDLTPTPDDARDQRTVKRRRDPKFRSEVLTAYGWRCAVCRLQVQLAGLTVGLEAAHIRWHQADGPDEVQNGVALCALHHKLFDLGCFTIDKVGRVIVSDQVSGNALDQAVTQYHGTMLDLPARKDRRPWGKYLDWHASQVFKGEPYGSLADGGGLSEADG